MVLRLQQKIPLCFPKQVVNKRSLQGFMLCSCSPEPFCRVTLSTWAAPVALLVADESPWRILRILRILRTLWSPSHSNHCSFPQAVTEQPDCCRRQGVIFKHYILRVGEIRAWCPKKYMDFSHWLVSLQISEQRTNKIALGLVSQPQCWEHVLLTTKHISY